MYTGAELMVPWSAILQDRVRDGDQLSGDRADDQPVRLLPAIGDGVMLPACPGDKDLRLRAAPAGPRAPGSPWDMSLMA